MVVNNVVQNTINNTTVSNPCIGLLSERKCIQIIRNCNIEINSNIVINSVIQTPKLGTSYIENCKIIRNGYVGSDVTSNNSSAIMVQTDCVMTIIKNCQVYSPNYAVACRDNTFIINSELSGNGHGAIYMNASTGKETVPCYIKDSILRLAEPHGNASTGYVGFGTILFDNCLFTSQNNNYNRIVLKRDTGSYTKAYFSNCDINSIRVDANCFAYIGLGMTDEIKEIQVDGKIIDTQNESYSFNLIEMDGE